ncbi:uncharacterized protein APUU_30340A [Aspergillus puulaauensis]|uniref:DNA-directed RNA polymerase III subunit RPC9 n=1 Tax=Aspergillus puulaauensis TaxID=1220207 RepID=A0A7R7XIJ3_9EURO|nr:uncharacterized protein APUU_30340A [Aspergillus puulaauensis]BCS22115.1 hypothetical protein APUU_30340A [Aspergillus puulaauensis]
MRIINPQDATLTNIEVLSYLSSNPPRRPPNAPPGVNQKHWIPSPDLRDHNTVVKEIHNYASRLSPHLLRYPQYASSDLKTGTGETPLDTALRELITRLRPYGLTKGEVLMIVNLGVGVPPGAPGAGGGEEEEAREGEGEGEGEGDRMDVDGQNGDGEGGDAAAMTENGVEEVEQVANGDGEAEGEAGEEGEEDEEGETGDYGALALIDTVIEEREQRLSDENVLEILAVIRETLGAATT